MALETHENGLDNGGDFAQQGSAEAMGASDAGGFDGESVSGADQPNPEKLGAGDYTFSIPAPVADICRMATREGKDGTVSDFVRDLVATALLDRITGHLPRIINLLGGLDPRNSAHKEVLGGAHEIPMDSPLGQQLKQWIEETHGHVPTSIHMHVPKE